jgi:hypothetical protein
MFSLFKMLFKPESDKNVRKRIDQKLYQVNQRQRIKKARNTLNLKVKNNGRGRADLKQLKLNSNKINVKPFGSLIKESELSKNKNPKYKVESDGVTFVLPFANQNRYINAKSVLNSIKNEKFNKGEFTNVNMNVKESNNDGSTILLKLSSKKNIKIILPESFVKRLYGVEDLVKKRTAITAEDVIGWAKYNRFGKDVRSVKDLLMAHEQMEKKKALYELWAKYGSKIAGKINMMRGVMDPKNIPNMLGKSASQEALLAVALQQAMRQYLNFERELVSSKTEMRVKLLYSSYVRDKKTILLANQAHLPRFCTVPYEWRVVFVHETMKDGSYDDGAPPGGTNTWKDYMTDNTISNKIRLIPNMIAPQDDNFLNKPQPVLPQLELGFAQQLNVSTLGNQYALFLRRARPYLTQLFHTIGSIRYPHTNTTPCPLTTKHTVWTYEFERRGSVRTNATYEDDWMKKLSVFAGFSTDLVRAHTAVIKILTDLVNVFKNKVRQEKYRRGRRLETDIELAWELYSICKKARLEEHPMFRVCAGFNILNGANPPNSEFMDRFRYMVHNNPNMQTRSESGPEIPFKLSQSDVKLFFLAADLYRNEIQNLHVRKIEHDVAAAQSVMNTSSSNVTKNSTGAYTARKPQVDCKPIIHQTTVALLEKNQDMKRGQVVVAWPTLQEAVEYYAS